MLVLLLTTLGIVDKELDQLFVDLRTLGRQREQFGNPPFENTGDAMQWRYVSHAPERVDIQLFPVGEGNKRYTFARLNNGNLQLTYLTKTAGKYNKQFSVQFETTGEDSDRQSSAADGTLATFLRNQGAHIPNTIS